jgi:hypothetical protein
MPQCTPTLHNNKGEKNKDQLYEQGKKKRKENSLCSYLK